MSLSPQQRKGLAALLTTPSRRDAAKALGIDEATIWRWLQLEEFRQEYDAALTRMLDEAIGQIHSLARKAVRCLERTLEMEVEVPTAAQVNAAIAVFKLLVEHRTLRELAARLRFLEKSDAGNGFRAVDT